MPVPRGPSFSEPVSLQDIQDEFLGANPISLNEYYAGGTYVRNPAPTSVHQIGTVPTSGEISIGNFLGLRRTFIFNDIVNTNLERYSLRARAIAAGYVEGTPIEATITVNPGVYISEFFNGYGVLLNGTWPADSTISLFNYGNIIGAGGNGGSGGRGSQPVLTGGSGLEGHTAMYLNNPMQIWNYNTISGGGGGGGGGGADSDGKTYFSQGGGGGGGVGVQKPSQVSNPGNVGGAGRAAANGWSAGVSGGTGQNPAAFGVGALPGLGGSSGGGVGGEFGEAGRNGSGNITAGGVGGVPGLAISGGTHIRWRHTGNIFGRMTDWGNTDLPLAYNYAYLMNGFTTSVERVSRFNTWSNDVLWYWRRGAEGNGAVNWAVGNYTYKMVYTNETGAPMNVALYGCVDNSIVEFLVNNTALALPSIGFSTPVLTQTFTLERGVNVITVTVNNGGQQAGIALSLLWIGGGLPYQTLVTAKSWYWAP